MTTLKDWLGCIEEKCQIRTYKLTTILNELDSHQDALKAANTFPIIYALITHVLSIFIFKIPSNFKVLTTMIFETYNL